MKRTLPALAPIALAIACAASTPPTAKPAEVAKPNPVAEQAAFYANLCWMVLDEVMLTAKTANTCDPELLRRFRATLARMNEVCDKTEAQKPPTLEALRRYRARTQDHSKFLIDSCTPDTPKQ